MYVSILLNEVSCVGKLSFVITARTQSCDVMITGGESSTVAARFVPNRLRDEKERVGRQAEGRPESRDARPEEGIDNVLVWLWQCTNSTPLTYLL